MMHREGARGGDVVHDFYTGLERIFERVAGELDGGLPSGSYWHRDLLDSMASEIAGRRTAVLRADTVRALGEYLRFRHLFRNTYGFELDWSRLHPLLDRMPSTWSSTDADISTFLVFLDVLAGVDQVGPKDRV